MVDLRKLKEEDIYSISMFILYKLTDIPEYSIVGELPYVLDKPNLLNFCNYFGGRTIKVPTVEELFSLIQVIKLYDSVKREGMPFEEALSRLNFKQDEVLKVNKIYNRLSIILDKYKFGRQ